MELPRALAPWASLLDLFPRELALSLGPLVQRLDRALGSPTPRSSRTGGQPDGFDGIARRGSYERLLLSEWLLADEVPDEFIRRAAMGEHAFLDPARTEPIGAGTTVALFDAGPNQWGAPRIAQLAALVVLARRASANRSNFVWGLLQAPEAPLNETVTAASVRRLLSGRSVREATIADLCSWRTHLLSGRDSKDAGEIDAFWIIGGPRLQPLIASLPAAALPLTLLEVQDPYEPEVRHLLTRVFRGGLPCGPSIELPLPDEKVAARLIRDPFDASATVPTTVDARLAPASNLLFAFGGTKLLARSAQGNVLIVYPIPNSVRAPAGKAKQYRSYWSDPMLAAGRVGKAVVAISLKSFAKEDDNFRRILRLESVSGKNHHLAWGDYTLSYRLPDREDGSAGPLLPCFVAPDSPKDVLALTSDGTLWRLHDENGTRTAKVEAMAVESIAPVPRGIAWVCRLNERRMVMTLHADGTRNIQDLDPAGTRSFFGSGSHGEFGLLAYQGAQGQWTILAKGAELHVTLPETAEGVGVAYVPHGLTGSDTPPPALVVIDAGRHSVSLLTGAGTSFTLPQSTSPIRTATVSPFSWQIAYVTEAGEVFVYSLADKELLYRSVVA